MIMRGSLAGCVVVVVWLLALLAQRSEGHITFFSPKEMMLMKEREGRKEMEDAQYNNEGGIKQHPRTQRGNPDKTGDIAGRPKQLEHMAPALEKILHQLVDEHQKARK